MNLLINNRNIPIIISIVGILIIISQFISFKGERKVTVERRTSKNSSYQSTVIRTFLMKFISKNEWLSKSRDTLQFNLGYLLSSSDRKNKELATVYLTNYIIFCVTEMAIIILIPKMLILVKLGIILTLLLLQSFIYRFVINGKKLTLVNYFPLMLSPFITNYVDTHNINETFSKSLSEVPDCYKLHIKRIINEVYSGISLTKALESLDKRVDYALCSSFVAIIRGSNATDRDISDNLISLELLIATDRANYKKNKDLLKDKKVNIFFWIGCILAELIFMGNYFKTYTGNYFLTTIEGQALLIGSVFAIAFAIILIIIADKT